MRLKLVVLLISVLALLGGASGQTHTFVDETTAQTLQNKTLQAPVVTGGMNLTGGLNVDTASAAESTVTSSGVWDNSDFRCANQNLVGSGANIGLFSSSGAGFYNMDANCGVVVVPSNANTPKTNMLQSEAITGVTQNNSANVWGMGGYFQMDQLAGQIGWPINTVGRIFGSASGAAMQNESDMDIYCRDATGAMTTCPTGLGNIYGWSIQFPVWEALPAHSAGIAVNGPQFTTWSSATTYPLNYVTQYSGVVYHSLQASNLNNQPDTSGTWWAAYEVPPQHASAFESEAGAAQNVITASPQLCVSKDGNGNCLGASPSQGIEITDRDATSPPTNQHSWIWISDAAHGLHLQSDGTDIVTLTGSTYKSELHHDNIQSDGSMFAGVGHELLATGATSSGSAKLRFDSTDAGSITHPGDMYADSSGTLHTQYGGVDIATLDQSGNASFAGAVTAGATNPVTIGGATGSCVGKVAMADGTGCVAQASASTGSLTGSGLTTGSAYYLNSSTLTLAKADSSSTVPAICVASSSTVCVYSGMITTGSWTAGGVLYVSDATSGALTQTAPSTSGHYIQRIGIAISATSMLVMPSLDVAGIQ